MRPVHILCCLLLSFGLAFPQEPFTVKVDVSLVTVEVGVTDSSGRPVTNLNQNEFEIYENGVLQELRTFFAVDTAYNVLLLFDCSDSTEPDWPFLLGAMNGFTRTLRPQDRVEVAQFGSGFKVLQGWTSRSSSPMPVTIQTQDPICNGTNFYGAVERTMAELQNVQGRKGAIVLSDGVHDRIPFRPSSEAAMGIARYVDAVADGDFQRVIRIVATSGMVFYFVAVDTDLNPDGAGPEPFDPAEIYNKQQVRSRLQQLALASGGRVVFPQTPADLGPLYEEIAQELGTSYGLGYVSSDESRDGSYRAIEVRVRDQSLHVRQSRDGYQAN